MTSYITNILNNRSLLEEQDLIIKYSNKKTEEEIYNETLEGFREDKPELSDEELNQITEDFLEKIRILLK